jgi:hypothetical protein
VNFIKKKVKILVVTMFQNQPIKVCVCVENLYFGLDVLQLNWVFQLHGVKVCVYVKDFHFLLKVLQFKWRLQFHGVRV